MNSFSSDQIVCSLGEPFHAKQPDYFILRMIISLLFEPFRNSSLDHLSVLFEMIVFLVKTAAHNLGFVPPYEYYKRTVLHCVGVKRSQHFFIYF